MDVSGLLWPFIIYKEFIFFPHTDLKYFFIYTLFIVDKKKHNTMYTIKIAMLIIGMLIDVNLQKIT